jgi:hypothetical protein
MGEYNATVRLTDSVADVRLGQGGFKVSRRDDINTDHGCPVAYIAGALGS